MGFSYSAYGGEGDLFGLSPGGVYQATPIAQGTGELLPHLFTLTSLKADALSGRYIFCGTFLIPELCLAATGDSLYYGPPCPVELGLSSPPDFCFT